MKKSLAAFALSTMMVTFAACGDDDGEQVRDCPEESGSEAASGSESGSASASGSEGECAESGSGSASASGGAVCDPFGNSAAADSRVNVTLAEFSVQLDQPSAPAGKIHFAIENAGADVHELVVVRAASIDDLPLDADGVLDEEAFPEGDFIGEVEGFPGGQTCDGTFELSAGDYVLLCAIVEEEEGGEVENHLAEGMAVEFTVE